MKKILCHGCFEYLHEGHLELLTKAKELGYVILGLESDSYVFNKKKRTPKSFEERKEVLLNTRLVDEIFLIPEGQNYLDLYKKIMPDILLTAQDEILNKKITDCEKVGIELLMMKKIDSSSNHLE